MAKNTRKADLAQVRKNLSVLRKKGLYSPKNVRAKPTKYALSIAKKYADVASGKAYVMKADTATLKKLSETYRVRKGRVVVPKFNWSDTARISRKTGEVEQFKRIGSRRYKFRPANATSLDNLPALKGNDTYLIPFRQGRKLNFIMSRDRAEILALAAGYEQRQKNAYADIAKFIQIGSEIDARGRPIVFEEDEEDEAA